MKIGITKNNGAVLLAALASLIGMIIYIITSVTGYLASSATNPWPIVCTLLAILLFGGVAFLEEKLSPVLADVLTAAGFVMLLVSFYFFVMNRVTLAADVYFIPVNYPAAEATALHISIAGVVLYLAAAIVLIVNGFTKKDIR